jgi:hypothetical protein
MGSKEANDRAVKYGSAGAAAGPYGALAGGVYGYASGWLDNSADEAAAAAKKAEQAKIAQERNNAIALSNYRLNSKYQYDQLKNDRYAPYAGYSQRLQSAFGQGMSGPQRSAVSIADTGVGAAVGSDAAGWDEDTNQHFENAKNGGILRGTSVHHTGYNEYLNGTAHAPGSDYQKSVGETGDGWAAQRRYNGTYVDAVGSKVPQEMAAAYMPGSERIAPQTQGGIQAPGTQFKFFPGAK